MSVMLSFISYIFFGLITNTLVRNFINRRTESGWRQEGKISNKEEDSESLALYTLFTVLIVIFHPLILPIILITDLSFIVTENFNKILNWIDTKVNEQIDINSKKRK